jgi:uncharacterized delta-60 repeat protein
MNARTCALALSALALFPAAGMAAAGDPDPSFGDGGRRLLSGIGFPAEVLVQADGKTLVVSDNQYSGLQGFVVTRLNVDGSVDRSYDGDGTATARVSDSDTPAGAALQPDGKLVVAGSGAGGGLAVARFDTDGLLDDTFDPGGTDGDGKKLIAGQSGAVDVVIQDGLITLANSRAGGTQDLAAVRLSESGGLDPTVFRPADFGGADDTAVAAAGAGDTGIVVIGRTVEAGRPVTAVARYTLDGKLDPTLGGSGKVTIPQIGDPKSVLVTPEGKIVVTGGSGGDDSHSVVVRLGDDGAPDASFGLGGVAAVDFAGADGAAGTALAPDGKILVAGSSYFDTGFYASRLTAAGAPDPSFAAGGTARFPVADLYAVGTAAALAPDGRFEIAGIAVMSGPIPRTVVARLAADPAAQPQSGNQLPDGGQQPQPKPLPDTQAPVLGALRLRAAYVRFRLSEPARVRFVLRRARRATRFTRSGVAGANRVRLARPLKPGRYRLTATATDAAGNAGRAQRVSFTVKKKGRP